MPIQSSNIDARSVSNTLLAEPAAPAASAVPRFDTIDLLRGLAILGVVLLHARIFLSSAGYEVGKGLPQWLRYLVFNQGGNGVSAFFAVSGFLITLVSVRRFGSLRALSLGAFYRISFARIAPALAVLLLVLSLLHFSGLPLFRIKATQGSLWHVLFAALTFQLNWFEAVHGWLPPNWTVLWSLSVEEMFYLFFPLLCVLLMRQRWTRPIFLSLLCALVLFGPFARTPWYTKNEIWSYQSYLGNLDNVALGCLFGLLAHRMCRGARIRSSRWPLCFQVVGSALMLFIAEWRWPQVILGWHIKHALGRSGLDVTLLGLGACLVMLGSVLREKKGTLWSAPVRWLGRYSYEVYLTHEFVVIAALSAFLRQAHRGPVAPWVFVTVLFSGMLGYFVSRLISEPANRFLRGAPVPAQLRN